MQEGSTLLEEEQNVCVCVSGLVVGLVHVVF